MLFYLIDRLPTPVLYNISPLQKLFDKIPDYSFLKVFGCSCFPCLRPYQSYKFKFHSTKCVFLGYNEFFKGYKCLSSIGKIYISRHVVFNEKEFPFASGFLNTKIVSTPILVSSPFSWHMVSNNLSNSATSSRIDHQQASPGASPNPESSTSYSPRESNQVEVASDSGIAELDQSTSVVGNGRLEESGETRLNDHPMATRGKSGIFKPKVPFTGVDKVVEVADNLDITKPQSVSAL